MPYTEKTLQELGFMYGTDKTEHGYLEFYEKHLPKNPKKILEIGVREGRSIKMWMQYFPETIIHGLDLFEEFQPPFQDERVVWHKGNQCDWLLLEQLRKEDFDVIIDDGSHNSRDQMMTFFGLFNGKHYFIEDLHCCDDPFYRDNLPYPFTAKQWFNQLRHPHGFQTIISGNNITLLKC